MVDSPFQRHRDFVLGHYSAAGILRGVVLSLWDDSEHQVGLSRLTTLDDLHFKALVEMLAHYRLHGRDDPTFRALISDIRTRLEEEQARSRKAEQFEGWLADLKRASSLGRQQIESRIDDHYTWVLTQFEQGATAEEAARLLAQRTLDDLIP